MLDFAAATFSTNELDNHRIDDYGEVLLILTDADIGLDGEVVWTNFAERESWDTRSKTVRVNGGTPRLVRAADPFEFVYGGTRGGSGPEKWEEKPIPEGYKWEWGQVWKDFGATRNEGLFEIV